MFSVLPRIYNSLFVRFRAFFTKLTLKTVRGLQEGTERGTFRQRKRLLGEDCGTGARTGRGGLQAGGGEHAVRGRGWLQEQLLRRLRRDD